jgi:methionyl aminopeptidase
MVEIKTHAEIERMRESGIVCAECMAEVLTAAKPGITTKELDTIAEKKIRKAGGEPSFKNYRGFPASICTSVNSEVVHGIPGNKVLEDGDILSIDLGVKLRGYHSDMARTVPIGKITADAKKLIEVTEKSFFAGIENAKNGNRLNDISQSIEFTVRASGFSVVRDLVGHGIGRDLHEQPDIPNFSTARRGPVLKNGMVLAIEPMVNIGASNVIWLDDGWTVKTADNTLSAHYENTIAITDDGPYILTMV